MSYSPKWNEYTCADGLGGAGIIYEDPENRFLTIRNKESGKLGFPKGRRRGTHQVNQDGSVSVTSMEPLLDCAVRETQEETGFTFCLGKRQRRGSIDVMGRKYYKVDGAAVRGVPVRLGGDEGISNVKFMTRDEIAADECVTQAIKVFFDMVGDAEEKSN